MSRDGTSRYRLHPPVSPLRAERILLDTDAGANVGGDQHYEEPREGRLKQPISVSCRMSG